MIPQPIVNIAEICAKHGITQAVICPGSRSAPLTLAFARHPEINTFVVPDERSGGFIGLGLAQSSNKPVVLICTSGTAAANFYPSVIEAFYQQVPLLVLSADRPPEWVDQQDGQTIRQQNILQNHVLASFQFPISFDHPEAVWHGEKMVSEAIVTANGTTRGPVHINVPIREPFYPSADEGFGYSENIKVIKSPQIPYEPTSEWKEAVIHELKPYDKILLVVGQTRISSELKKLLNQIQKKLKWVIVGDITANIHELDHAVLHHDILLENEQNKKPLQPDLLITFGQSILSKNLKTFLRNGHSMAHWHVDTNSDVVDPFKVLTQKIALHPEVFFDIIASYLWEPNPKQNSYFNHWIERDLQSTAFLQDFFKTEKASEFHAVERILSGLPDHCHLHLANSMTVRYANYFGLKNKKQVAAWSNRGTSGIDGCVSTAVGHAINSDDLNIIITGDLAFFYDRNALWHHHLPHNLRIIVLNNHGGGIFRLINGPKQLDELETYFETPQKLTAANTARDFGMTYFMVKSTEALPDMLGKFFSPQAGPSILEIETDPKTNQQVFEAFKQKSAQKGV